MSAKVLLVDDSSTALLLEETVFKKHTAYEVVTARDGEEAVLKAVTEKPDLILMDVVMPKMDGFTACREIRKKEGLKGVPIVMVTSRGEPANVQTGYESGCNAYLTKPINAAELLEMVHLLLSAEGSQKQSGNSAVTEGGNLV
jgi:DNA-binding response OmpR family regulator